MKDDGFHDLLKRMDALHSDEVVVERGQTLFQQDDPGDSFYLVKTGRLRVIYNLGLPTERFVGEVSAGEPVGELALLWSSTRSATVIAVRFTVLARISKAAFDQLTHQYPAEAMELMRVVAWRLKQSYEGPSKRSLPSNIAVVPANGDVPLAAYCARLVDRMPAWAGVCRILKSNDVPPDIAAAAEKAGLAAMKGQHHELARWLSEQSDECAINILQTDSSLTPWTQRCLHQADLVVILGRAGADPIQGRSNKRSPSYPILMLFRELISCCCREASSLSRDGRMAAKAQDHPPLPCASRFKRGSDARWPAAHRLRPVSRPRRRGGARAGAYRSLSCLPGSGACH